MSDQSQLPNGADHDEAAQPSLRDIAEAAYDTVVEQSDDDGQELEPGGQPRDERGRWVTKSQEGEAEAETPPSPSETTQETDQEHPAPEQPGQAAQPPSNWSAEDRANFEKLPPEGQQFLLRRHSEMESDYQKRIQATTVSNQFVNALTPVFTDPAIVQSMNGRTPVEAIYELFGFQKRAVDPNPNTRIELLFELADRMQLDPAVVFGHQQQRQAMAFSQEELANPSFKKFADHIGLLTSKLQASEAVLNGFQQQQQQALFNARRAEIDQIANTKNQDGTPAYPYFDDLLPIMMEHYRKDPSKSIVDCYHAAAGPFIAKMEGQIRARHEQQQNLARAQSAVRGNLRGTTAPVNKPAPPEGRRSLRDTLDASAEEVGFTG